MRVLGLKVSNFWAFNVTCDVTCDMRRHKWQTIHSLYSDVKFRRRQNECAGALAYAQVIARAPARTVQIYMPEL